jgi:tRNA 2-thiouridine synthesizing protein A
MDWDEEIDASGLLCPLPVLRARKAIERLAPGAVLQILATDPGSVRDVQAFCEATGHALLEQAAQDGAFSFRVRKAG